MTEVRELEQSELFRELPDEFIADVLKISRIQQYEAGETIFHEDDPATHLYLLRSGQVFERGDDRLRRLALAGPFRWRGFTLVQHVCVVRHPIDPGRRIPTRRPCSPRCV